jgi:hypothetical protein
MTDDEAWDELCEVWEEKQQALLSYRLFEHGMMQNDRLAEYERLRDEERRAREAMDDFIRSRFPGAKL